MKMPIVGKHISYKTKYGWVYVLVLEVTNSVFYHLSDGSCFNPVDGTIEWQYGLHHTLFPEFLKHEYDKESLNALHDAFRLLPISNLLGAVGGIMQDLSYYQSENKRLQQQVENSVQWMSTKDVMPSIDEFSTDGFNTPRSKRILIRIKKGEHSGDTIVAGYFYDIEDEPNLTFFATNFTEYGAVHMHYDTHWTHIQELPIKDIV